MKLPAYALVIIILSVCGSAHAAPVPDLLVVLEQAEKTDPQYREVKENALAVAEEVPQAQAALWLPEMYFNGALGRVNQDISISGGFGTGGKQSFNRRHFLITLNQPVLHYDRYVALGQASKQLQQAQYEVQAAQQALIVRVAERYFGVLAAQDDLAFATAEKQSLQGQLEQAQQRFEVGLIAITDVQEAQAGYDRAVASEIVAKYGLDNAREALRETTETYYEDLARLGKSIRLTPPDPADIDVWTQTALEQNLEIAAANVAAEIAHDEIRIQKAGHLPTLDIVGTHGFDASGGRFGASNLTQSEIAVELNVPLYEGGRIDSQTRQAGYEHNAALQRLEQRKRAVYRQTREAYLGVTAEISNIKALKQAVLSSTTSLESTRAGFEVGTRTGIDVVDAERGLFQARRNYSRARYNYILEILRLKQAAGTLIPDDLAIANSWLVE